MSNGYNPLRWNCDRQGCFNKKNRPKIEAFAECLPGRIAFSDIDAITEVNGHFLILEWKSFTGDIPMGQRIMYERMTKTSNFTVVIISGDAETMDIRAIKSFRDGRGSKWKPCNLDDLKAHIKTWACRVQLKRNVS